MNAIKIFEVWSMFIYYFISLYIQGKLVNIEETLYNNWFEQKGVTEEVGISLKCFDGATGLAFWKMKASFWFSVWS